MTADPTDDIIFNITRIRARNNINWMEILQIALRHAPDDTKAVLRRIDHYDRCITTQIQRLTE